MTINLLSRTGKNDEANEPSDWAVYSKPLQRRILVSLYFVVLWNSILFTFSVAATILILYPSGMLGNWEYYPPPTDARDQFVVFLFWCSIPLVIWATSCFELYKYWRRTLGAKRIVITASFSSFLWVATAVYWLPCIYSWWETTWFEWNYHPQYCPFSAGPGWYPHDGYIPPPPSAYYLLPWLVLPALMFYSSYLTWGGIALHRQRTAKAKALLLGNTFARGVDAELMEKRYKITSSLYTDVNTESNWPSTLHSNAESPTPSTRPPSYGELSSGRPSVRSVERAHVRISRSEAAVDVERGSRTASRSGELER